MGYGVGAMRRCILLTGGLCAVFCVIWSFCAHMTVAHFSAEPVLSLAPEKEIQSRECLQFPFEIPGTTLIAEQIVSYDGLHTVGDKTGNVSNVAALMLYNYGEDGITEALVQLQAGQVHFAFEADTIPAGARILVPEQDGKEFGPKEFTACSGSQSVDDSDWLMEQRIQLAYPQMGEVVVSNLTGSRLTGICLYYKTYYQDMDFYVGGKTQMYYIQTLEPGEYIRIYPYNYALGYSKFARIVIGKS